MEKNAATAATLVVAATPVALVVAFVVCCGLCSAFGQGQRTAREAAAEREPAERHPVATGAARRPDPWTDPQTDGSGMPSAPLDGPPWQHPTRIAGDEAGYAKGLSYERIFELGYEVWKAGQNAPKPVDAVAKAEGLDPGLVEDAMVTYGENRKSMLEHLESGVLGAGVLGEVEVDAVMPTEIGPFTVTATLIVYGCPGSALTPEVNAAAAKVAKNLPRIASGYEAQVLWSGLRCSPGVYGRAVYRADTATVTVTQ